MQVYGGAGKDLSKALGDQPGGDWTPGRRGRGGGPSGRAAAGSPLYRYYAAYLDALDARQRSQAERIRCQWLDLNRLTAARLSALNPHWDASLWSSMFIHNTTLLCDAADQDLLGNYHAISASYLLLDQLACEMGEYMSVGIIRQFHIS